MALDSLSWVFWIIQGLIVVVLWFAKRNLNNIEAKQEDIQGSQKEILKEVRTTNGRVTRLETQIVEHNVRDDERFQSIDKQLDRLERRVDG